MTNRKSLEDYSSIKNLLSSHPEAIIQMEKVACTACKIDFEFRAEWGVSNIKRHFESETHKYNVEISEKQIKKRKDMIFMKKTHEDEQLKFLHYLSKLNIPLYTVDKNVFKDFANDFLNIRVASSSYYREKLPLLYKSQVEKLKDILKNKDFFIIADSSSDAQSHNILNVMIGICDPTKPSIIYLLESLEMKSSNANSYSSTINEIISRFFGENLNCDYFKLFISDRARVMLKTGENLKGVFKNLKHVTCLAHLCHNICEKIRSLSNDVNLIVSLLKRLLIKNNNNKNIFKSITKLSVPAFPITTRWGTWLVFIKFLFDNYAEIGDFLKEMDVINKTDNFKIYTSTDFEKQLRFCYEHIWLVDIINYFETQNLATEKQIEYLRELSFRISDKRIKDYLSLALSENPDINYFMNFNQMRARRDEKIYSFVPLVSVEVERSFSLYRQIFSDQRQSISSEKMNYYLFLYFNKNL